MRITVGHDIRAWAEYDVDVSRISDDLLAELKSAEPGDTNAALLEKVDSLGALTFVSEEYDPNPDRFAPESNPSIVEVVE